MGKSWSQTIMKDQRLAIEEAQIVAAPESVLTVTQALPGAVAVARGATVGDVVIQEYTPEVRQTVSELVETVQLVSKETIPMLVESFGEAMARTSGLSIEALRQMSETASEAGLRTSEAGMRATDILGAKLQETQLGQASILPGMAKYLLIAAVVIIVAGKVWK